MKTQYLLPHKRVVGAPLDGGGVRPLERLPVLDTYKQFAQVNIHAGFRRF